jgi:hypothetical protein
MLSFFEMCNLLQKQREKLLGISEAGEFLKKFGETLGKKKSAGGTPTAEPQQASILPTPVAGDAPTPAPQNSAADREAKLASRVSSGVMGDLQRRKEAEERQAALKAQQDAWDQLKADVLKLSKRTKNTAKIAEKLGASEQDVKDILEPADMNPFTGSEDAAPVEDNSDEIGPDYTGDTETVKGRQGGRKVTARGAAYFVDKVMDWNNYLASPVYQEFTKMAAKALGFPYKFPPSSERFEISLDVSKGATSGPREVVMNKHEFMKITQWVRDYLGFDGKGVVHIQPLGAA